VEGLKQLTAALGLPPDGLSTALISFIRHFSLPLEPKLLAGLRRDLLALKTPKDAAVLAAAAALDKGLKLSPGALLEYAAAIDPESRRGGDNAFQSGTGGRESSQEQEPSQDQRQGQEQKSSQDQQQGHGQEPGQEPNQGQQPDQDQNHGGNTNRARPGEERDAEWLRKKAIEAQGPVLGFLNAIPGRDRRRWMVFPLDFASPGGNFRVTLRILLDECLPQGKVSRLAVDIAGDAKNNDASMTETGTGDGRRWLFILDKPGEPEARTDIWRSPPLPEPERKTLEREIRETLDLQAGQICLHNAGIPPFADSRNDALPSINEEV
jgi:hypothetical protein